MSVQVTRLPSGLSVVTDDMPHLKTAALGVWVGSGSRDESADEHGISHLLEHMAFKGTRTALSAPDRRGDRGGRRRSQRRHQRRRAPPISRACSRYDVPLALDVLSDILGEPTFDADELKREQNVIVQEIGAIEDAPDDLVFDRLQEIAFPEQAVGRSILGTPATVRSFTPGGCAIYLARNYRGPDMLVAAAGAVEHAADRRRVGAALCRFHRAGGAGAGAGDASAAARGSSSATSSRCISRSRSRACAVGDERLYSLQVFTNVLGGGMSSRLFQEVRESRGLCYAIHAFHVPYADTGMFALYAGTDQADAPELMRVVIDEIAGATENHQRGRGRPRQGADAGRRPDGAGELGSAYRPIGAADDGLWPTDPARRDRRQDRRSERRQHACRRPRPDLAAAARRSPRSGLAMALKAPLRSRKVLCAARPDRNAAASPT